MVKYSSKTDKGAGDGHMKIRDKVQRWSTMVIVTVTSEKKSRFYSNSRIKRRLAFSDKLFT